MAHIRNSRSTKATSGQFLKMKIFLIHNFYQQPGGEDQVFADEAALLEANGHEVTRFSVHNDAIREMGGLRVAALTLWSRPAYRDLRHRLRLQRPDVVHFHNTFPLISPAAYAAARAEGCAVVQTLHNYRLMCANALFFRAGQACELCLGRRIAWPGVVHGCYRGSRPASAVVAAMLATHWALGTYRHGVDIYIALSEFALRKFIQGGLPPEQVVIKPNFVDPDPGIGVGGGGFALFVGRLSEGKGVETLLAAWPRLGKPVPLKIIGDGDLAPLVRRAVASAPQIEWLGRRPSGDVYEMMGRADLVVIPSTCYETFGRVAIEAFAKGTPVVASDHGAVAELVEHGRTGRLFRVGDPEDLARQVDFLLDDPSGLAAMRRRARQAYEGHYTGTRNYEALMDIYRRARDASRPRAADKPPRSLHARS